MDTILIVDDESNILTFVKYNLEKEGYSVFSAETGDEAISILHDEVIDLAILDVMLPNISGFNICKKMRHDERLKNIPVLFMTALDSDEDICKGFEVGGDDYLTKPFANKVLLARVKALLHRNGSDKETYNLGTLELFFDRHLLKIDNKRISVTPREFSVLSAIILRKNRTVSRNSLLERGWGMETTSSLRSVDIIITRIRSKLKDYGKYIRTVTGYGYQWDEESFNQD